MYKPNAKLPARDEEDWRRGLGHRLSPSSQPAYQSLPTHPPPSPMPHPTGLEPWWSSCSCSSRKPPGCGDYPHRTVREERQRVNGEELQGWMIFWGPGGLRCPRMEKGALPTRSPQQGWRWLLNWTLGACLTKPESQNQGMVGQTCGKWFGAEGGAAEIGSFWGAQRNADVFISTI